MPSKTPSPLITVTEARARLFALAQQVDTETISIRDAAGRWAAGDILALRTQPAADLSAMDGYAIRFADLPGPLTLIGESAAGRAFSGTLGSGETVRIFTGAAMPAGADTVLVQEEAARDGDRVTLAGEGPKNQGRNIRRKGLDFSTGDLLVAKGDRLTPARIAVAATGGHGALIVPRRLRVAVVATGDELVAPGTALNEAVLPESI
jgi:molybdopterin molybdotransferase